jgi:4-hydroxy-tetrahydrodipicolinate synthase
MSDFSGIWIPLITPFQDGEVDHVALRRLVRYCANGGVAGFVALGTTGEPSSLTPDEQDAVLATVLEVARGLPVLAGVAGNNVAQLQERVRRLNDQPIAGLLVPAPYYVRPSQAGLIEFFTGVADVSAKPVVIYDIPYRTGVRIDVETLLTLAAHPRIVAIKDCAGSVDTSLALLRDGRLQVLTGEDINAFNLLCLGGSGAIAASAHVCPERFVAMYSAVKEGRLGDARTIFHTLAPIISALFAEPNPAPLKAWLAQQGLASEELRAPLTHASDALRERLRAFASAAPVSAAASS